MQPEAELGDSDSEAGSDANKVSKRKKKLESRLQIAELKQVCLILCCVLLHCAATAHATALLCCVAQLLPLEVLYALNAHFTGWYSQS